MSELMADEKDPTTPAEQPPEQAPAPAEPAVSAEAPARDLSKLSPLQQQMSLSAQRGAESSWRSWHAFHKAVAEHVADGRKVDVKVAT